MSCATSTNRRWLALWFPHLSTDRWRLSSRSDGPDEPLVLVGKDGNTLRLAAVCPQAKSLGLLPGLALADARARVPDIRVGEADPKADARLLVHLAERSERWSPTVALDSPDGLLIETSGSAHLFGGEDSLGRNALALFGRRFSVRHAFASTPRAAHALSRFSSAPRPEGEAIRRLPVAALELDPDCETALRRAGLKYIADLADRPTAPLVARFGRGTADALDRLLGRIDTVLALHRSPPALHFAERFAEPLSHSDAALAVLDRLSHRAARSLQRRGAGGRLFVARLFRSDGAVRDLAVETGRPTRDPALLGRLFRERIDGLADPLDPGFGYDVIQLDVPATEPLDSTQPDLDRTARREEAMSLLIDRLSVRYGRTRIRRILPSDSHVPERAARSHPALDLAPCTAWPDAPAGEPPLRPICLFDPPQIIEAIAEVPDSPPRRFRWRGQSHDVVRAEGPERIAAPWWQTASRDSPTRDYYRVEDSEGRRFWLFRRGLHDRETLHPRWYIHGLFA